MSCEKAGSDTWVALHDEWFLRLAHRSHAAIWFTAQCILHTALASDKQGIQGYQR